MITIVPTLFDANLSDISFPHPTISKEDADELFTIFQKHSLFDWKNFHNGCEGRADAVCVLLDEWGIPNFKGWVFSGSFFKNHIGQLKQNWKYHVAPLLPVLENGQTRYYIIDPSTGDSLQLIEEWAAAITQLPHSYYFMRQAHWYIFPEKNIRTETWNTRNRQNRKWMVQCLAGINSLTKTGKAQLCFNKTKIRNKLMDFHNAKNEKISIRLGQ